MDYVSVDYVDCPDISSAHGYASRFISDTRTYHGTGSQHGSVPTIAESPTETTISSKSRGR